MIQWAIMEPYKMLMKKRCKRGCEGYTLLELVVVLGILVILLMAVVPQLNGVVDAAHKMAAKAEAIQVAEATKQYVQDHFDAGTLDLQSFKVLVNLQLDKPGGPLQDYIGVCQEESRIESINTDFNTGHMSQITYINKYDRVRVTYSEEGERAVISNASQF